MTITHKGHPLFFVDQLSSHTWLPRLPQLFTDVLATASMPASSRWLSAMASPVSSPRPPAVAATAPRPAASCQQHLSCHGALASIFPMALRYGAPASNSSATAPRQQQLRYGALASIEPHPAEKSTPVWLAIWHIWAGFANSQLPRAAFRSTY